MYGIIHIGTGPWKPPCFITLCISSTWKLWANLFFLVRNNKIYGQAGQSHVIVALSVLIVCVDIDVILIYLFHCKIKLLVGSHINILYCVL